MPFSQAALQSKLRAESWRVFQQHQSGLGDSQQCNRQPTQQRATLVSLQGMTNPGSSPSRSDGRGLGRAITPGPDVALGPLAPPHPSREAGPGPHIESIVAERRLTPRQRGSREWGQPRGAPVPTQV
ncbi:hypothetical protein NDU88_010346 [Pleurodeles waltl]|uniref:Uncharacterized protein n=1 Tax=Pleurodeles waltl TaxID=8319 RepID=A0AAV7QU55_PLEWA|nr:hypothetical protein NDU88_010346 [Pleurodeles waltl]